MRIELCRLHGCHHPNKIEWIACKYLLRLSRPLQNLQPRVLMHVEQGVFESHIAEAMTTKERTTIKVKIMVFMSFEFFFFRKEKKKVFIGTLFCLMFDGLV